MRNVSTPSAVVFASDRASTACPVVNVCAKFVACTVPFFVIRVVNVYPVQSIGVAFDVTVSVNE